MSKFSVNLMIKKTAQVICAVFLFLISSLSISQSDLNIQIVGCASIDDDNSRLYCYDRVGKQLMATDSPSVDPMVDGNEPQSTSKSKLIEKQSVAQNVDSLGAKYIQKETKSGSESSEFELKMVHMEKNARGLWEFHLENGQRWRQLEAKYMSKPKTFPAIVTISEGAFGSYALKVMPKGKRIKVRRVL